MGRGLGSLVSSLIFSYAEYMDDATRDSSDLEKRLEQAIARQQAQLDAFIEKTENELAELESSIEGVRGLSEQQAEIPDGIEERLEQLESLKIDVPTEIELLNREYDANFKKQLEEEQQEELTLKISLLDDRIESLEGLDKQERDDSSRMEEMAAKLAELEVKLSLLQEYVRSRLK
jgi:DNA repair exonuclease SbcCD ATPase subunit